MNEELISQIYSVKSSTIEHMKWLLQDVKEHKNNELEQKIHELQKELQTLRKSKKYGLVWEEKQEIFDKETQNKLPVLEEISKNHLIESDSESHILIEWDNYHTLSVLSYTHAGKIDVIYIDPPYNTGNKSWRYNNNYVEKDDTFRHSKWLSFMNKRLLLAKNLLTENGCLVFAIDHNEVHTSWLLLQEIFPEKEITCVTVIHNPSWIQWKNFSHNNEYVFFAYPNSVEKSINFEVRNSETADKRNFINSAKWNTQNYLRETGYNCFYPILVKDDEILGFWTVPNKDYHPEKSNIRRQDWVIEIYPIDNDWIERKWTLARKSVDSFKHELKLNWNKKKKFYGIIRVKEEINYKTVWIDKKFNAKKYWTELLKDIIDWDFPFPKSLYLVQECLTAVLKNKNATILDFFAGSGTTGHAVLELNKEDGGNRKFILATNNENNICEEVTYQRVKKVIQGYRNKKWERVDWLGGNLRYLKTAFIEKTNTNDDLRKRMVARCSELLCLKENIWNPVKISHEYIALFQRNDRYLAILYDMFYFEDFLKELQKLEKPISVYCFSYYPLSGEDFESIEQDISIEQIPDPILQVYESIFWL